MINSLYKMIIAIISVFITIITCFIYLHGLHHVNDDICNSSECIKLSNSILQNMNTSIDPCDDFHLFTCGNYNRSYFNVNLTGIVPTFDFSDYNGLLRKEIESPINDNDNYIIQNIKNYYKSCIHYKPLTSIKDIYYMLNIDIFNFKNTSTINDTILSIKNYTNNYGLFILKSTFTRGINMKNINAVTYTNPYDNSSIFNFTDEYIEIYKSYANELGFTINDYEIKQVIKLHNDIITTKFEDIQNPNITNEPKYINDIFKNLYLGNITNITLPSPTAFTAIENAQYFFVLDNILSNYSLSTMKLYISISVFENIKNRLFNKNLNNISTYKFNNLVYLNEMVKDISSDNSNDINKYCFIVTLTDLNVEVNYLYNKLFDGTLVKEYAYNVYNLTINSFNSLIPKPNIHINIVNSDINLPNLDISIPKSDPYINLGYPDEFDNTSSIIFNTYKFNNNFISNFFIAQSKITDNIYNLIDTNKFIHVNNYIFNAYYNILNDIVQIPTNSLRQLYHKNLPDFYNYHRIAYVLIHELAHSYFSHLKYINPDKSIFFNLISPNSCFYNMSYHHYYNTYPFIKNITDLSHNDLYLKLIEEVFSDITAYKIIFESLNNIPYIKLPNGLEKYTREQMAYIAAIQIHCASIRDDQDIFLPGDLIRLHIATNNDKTFNNVFNCKNNNNICNLW